jgi:hypothetical protein
MNDEISKSNILLNILVWGLITGTYLSNIPQYYRLIKKKNTLGISEYMLIFGIYSCLLNILGAVMENRDNLYYNCIVNHNTQCYNLIISLFQLASPYISSLIFYIIFFYYSKNQVLIIIGIDVEDFKNIKRRFIFNILFNFFLLIYTILNMKFASQKINHINNDVFNILSCISSIIMWIPQIINTYKIKGNYSLSIIATFIHSIGCALTVVFQFVLNSQNIFIVLPYIIGFTLEVCVIILCIYYKKVGVNKKHDLYHNFIDPVSINIK